MTNMYRNDIYGAVIVVISSLLLSEAFLFVSLWHLLPAFPPLLLSPLSPSLSLSPLLLSLSLSPSLQSPDYKIIPLPPLIKIANTVPGWSV